MPIADKKQISALLDKLAAEIKSAVPTESLILVGIQRRGVFLAQRLGERLEKLCAHKISQGVLDITFYRDDLSMIAQHPVVHSTDFPEDINGRDIVLVDDVLFTGRTVKSALGVLSDYGRAKSVKLAVLVDRGWREMPIAADFVGLKVQTKYDEEVCVNLEELDGEDSVEVVPK